MSTPYLVCPNCSRQITTNYIEFINSKNDIANDNEMTEDEKNDAFGKLVTSKYKMDCCKMVACGDGNVYFKLTGYTNQ